MPMPDVLVAPSMVIGAEGSGAIAARSPPSWKPATLFRVGSLLGGRLTRIGPPCVAMVTFAGTITGSTSLTWSGTVCPLVPTMTICVPAAAKLPTTCSARVTVRKLQLGLATPPTMPLPVAIASSPFSGSTKYFFPDAGAQPVQLLLTQRETEPSEGQSASAPPLHGPRAPRR